MAARQNGNVIFVIGPTSAGKTDLAIKIAQAVEGELISADSRQVYRGLDIGTGKDLSFPHHLTDNVAPGGEMYNLGQFLTDSRQIIHDVWQRNHVPVVVGGTGLYVTALLKGYELPTVRQERGTWHKRNKPDFEALVIGINPERHKLYDLIDKRLLARISAGLIEEVEDLIADGVPADWLYRLGLEYRFTVKYLRGEFVSKEAYVEKLKFAIHAYARRQLTWLRHQVPGVKWVRGDEEALALTQVFIKTNNKKISQAGRG